MKKRMAVAAARRCLVEYYELSCQYVCRCHVVKKTSGYYLCMQVLSLAVCKYMEI